MRYFGLARRYRFRRQNYRSPVGNLHALRTLSTCTCEYLEVSQENRHVLEVGDGTQSNSVHISTTLPVTSNPTYLLISDGRIR